MESDQGWKPEHRKQHLKAGSQKTTILECNQNVTRMKPLQDIPLNSQCSQVVALTASRRTVELCFDKSDSSELCSSTALIDCIFFNGAGLIAQKAGFLVQIGIVSWTEYWSVRFDTYLATLSTIHVCKVPFSAKPFEVPILSPSLCFISTLVSHIMYIIKSYRIP
jgi:hypothetical protein